MVPLHKGFSSFIHLLSKRRRHLGTYQQKAGPIKLTVFFFFPQEGLTCTLESVCLKVEQTPAWKDERHYIRRALLAACLICCAKLQHDFWICKNDVFLMKPSKIINLYFDSPRFLIQVLKSGNGWKGYNYFIKTLLSESWRSSWQEMGRISLISFGKKKDCLLIKEDR